MSKSRIQHYVYSERPPTSHSKSISARTTQPNSVRPKNLVVILEESLGARFVERLGGQALTPNLNQLAEQGWWFPHMYATGTRSVRGIEAVITGFLPTPGRSVVKLASSTSQFFTLATLLDKSGYQSTFYYGGDANFDNMKGFALANGFNNVVEESDFQNPKFTGSWGVSDEDLFDRIHHDLMNTRNQPKFIATLTTSNHTPFEFPVEEGDQYTKPVNTRENAVRYADKALGEFIRKAQKSIYWNDTVFLIVADHDLRVADFITAPDPADKNKTIKIFPVEGFHIPALIMGGSIRPKETNAIVSQIDLPPTLLGLIDIHTPNPMLGMDLTQIDKQYQGRAIMQFSDYQAYLDGEQLVILRPYLSPLTGVYKDRTFTPQLLSNDLDQKALAHALWASQSYLEKSYRLN